MNTSRAKAVAFCSLAIGMLVVLACAVAFRDRVAEQWYLYKLESGELQEQKVAAEKLAEMGSAGSPRWGGFSPDSFEQDENRVCRSALFLLDALLAQVASLPR